MQTAVTRKLDAYDDRARAAVVAAQKLADDRGHAEIEPLHLLYALFDQSEPMRAAARRAGSEPDDVLVEAEWCLRRLPRRGRGTAYLSPRFLELLTRAEREAARAGSALVDEGGLLLATAQVGIGDAQVVLGSCGLRASSLRAALQAAAPAAHHASGQPELLTRVGRDLTHAARHGHFDPIIGRAGELRRVLQVLARHKAHNPLLVGEPGVGKDAIVRALCARLAAGDVPALLAGRRILELDVAALLGDARHRQQAEQHVRAFLAAVADQAGEVIVYLRTLEPLFGDRTQLGVAHILGQALREGTVQLIVATDPATHRRWLAESELAQQFVAIRVEATSVAETIAVLRGVVHRYESAHGLSISDPALVAAARFAKRYLPFAQLPKGAIDLVDEAAARVRVAVQSVPPELDQLERAQHAVALQLESLRDDTDPASTRIRAELQAEQARLVPEVEGMRTRWQRELSLLQTIGQLKEEIEAAARSLGSPPQELAALPHGPTTELYTRLAEAQQALADSGPFLRDAVGEADVAEVIAERTGVPVTRMLEAEADKLLHMETRVGARVIGQAQAVAAVSRAVRRSRVGLRHGSRPIGSFMFLGSSGVGKTELAKAIAEFLFDDESALTRLDMSEFMEKHSVARLLGSPPGYVDSEEGGFLTEAVRRRPYSVILLDEVEKAHPDVFNVMLQVLDDGRLTDARGRLAHFSDTVVIMTSNIGSHHVLQADLSPEQVSQRINESLRGHFRPEFLNRIDEVITFNALDKAALRQILMLQLQALRKLLEPRQVTLEVSAGALAHLVDLAYEPAFGARPLRRVIQRHIQDPLAEQLLQQGTDALRAVVLFEDGQLALRTIRGSK